MTAGVRTEEPLPSQPSKKSSETSATEGHTCLEVPRSAARTRECGGRQPRRIKTCGHSGEAPPRANEGLSRRTVASPAARRVDAVRTRRERPPDSASPSSMGHLVLRVKTIVGASLAGLVGCRSHRARCALISPARFLVLADYGF